MRSMTVAILGAGPTGLAAAAHVLERDMTPLILEQGPEVGHAVRAWRHVPMFSDWSLNTDAAAVRRLATTGWTLPDPRAYPTGDALVSDYLEPLAATLGRWLHLQHKVIGVYRDGLDKVRDAGRNEASFVIETDGPVGPETFRADAVIDATGTWSQPNPGGNGRAVPGEAGHPKVTYGMPDAAGGLRGRFQGKRVAVLGGGHSAVGNLIALASLPGTTPIWLCRATSTSRALGGGKDDQLAARGSLGLEIAALVSTGRVAVETGFRLSAIKGADTLVAQSEDGRRIVVDELVISTGFRPDLSLFRELRVALDPALECPPSLAPLIDPNQHSCGTVRPHGAAELAHPEPGFWIAGMKSYGRAPTFLMATGHEQVRSIVAKIAGDDAAAARVDLVLPETGVCNGPGPQLATEGRAQRFDDCCGGPATTRENACCKKDEDAKDHGDTGCGCDTGQNRSEIQKVAGCC